ncbi:MEMO1 family [Dactylonectria macrodidyma]|uniref:MEMO1 family n=1 Tax=Dactylonectria macrodidyma TaxID=307937 RepID=A0A9P9F677_9HYPO|nr:MEMO1 family [Dactylonectria macrodidyma]
MTTRPAGKAGPWVDRRNKEEVNGWYIEDSEDLQQQLSGFLAAVPDSLDGVSLPIPGARIVIAPHAGYKYSGACAAWAYKALDLSRAKRVFILGPSHTYYLQGCAATTFDKYATPFGDLTVDRETAQEIKDAADMDDVPVRYEKNEHSLEMHTPYLYYRIQQTFASPAEYPKIVPLLIGSNKGSEEKAFGEILLPYLKDPENAFIISSDFCHWGDYFNYMVHSPTNSPADLKNIREWDPKPRGPPIHETIRVVDESAMDAVKSGSHDAFLASLKQTRNTVCGRHPIGVMMAALELLRREPGFEDKGRFNVIQYDRSKLVELPSDSSVSYVSAYAVA